ncbi:hypothetical protein VTN77DRAFT_2133 [Rasamsonia byssochlamydoides]|uniref:uncharacterized protein n=1 Tax=Rasamsonia byssochlamydoides TaxID=89139 RepID=UPI003742B75D
MPSDELETQSHDEISDEEDVIGEMDEDYKLEGEEETTDSEDSRPRKRTRSNTSLDKFSSTLADEKKNKSENNETIRRYSRSGGIPDLKKKDAMDLLSMLDNPERQICTPDDVPAINQLPRGSMILLHGMLSSFICSENMEKPFLFLDSALDKPDESKVKSSRTIGDKEHEFEQAFMKFASRLAESKPLYSSILFPTQTY